MREQRINPGVYRRRIRTTTAAGLARVEMEDDAHRFAVELHHDGRHVTAVAGTALRTPWSSCPEAAAMLRRLVGMPLAPTPLAAHRHTAAQLQCTHMFDMAGLAIAHAARGVSAMDYEIAVVVTDRAAPRRASLRRDGRAILDWTLDGARITAPDSVAGQDLRTILPWAERACATAEAFEAVVVLRRAVHISEVRLLDLDALPSADALGRYTGACWVFQPERVAGATRNGGSTRDFSASPEQLLGDRPSGRS